jgi:hypothetical protein
MFIWFIVRCSCMVKGNVIIFVLKTVKLITKEIFFGCDTSEIVR